MAPRLGCGTDMADPSLIYCYSSKYIPIWLSFLAYGGKIGNFYCYSSRIIICERFEGDSLL